VELLVKPVLGGDTGIDRAADRFDGGSLHGRASIAERSSLSRRPKKRGPFHLVPVIAKATLDRLAAPGKAIRQHHHPLWPPIPFPDSQRIRPALSTCYRHAGLRKADACEWPLQQARGLLWLVALSLQPLRREAL